MSASDLTEGEYVRRQKLIIVIVVALALTFVMLRINLHPGYTDEGFQPFYDDLCHVLRSDSEAEAEALYTRAKKELRRTGTQADVMFFFQFIGIYTDHLKTPKGLEDTDQDIRKAVMLGAFEDAREQVRDALINTDEMTDGRAKAWGKLIRELERRWDNDCSPS